MRCSSVSRRHACKVNSIIQIKSFTVALGASIGLAFFALSSGAVCRLLLGQHPSQPAVSCLSAASGDYQQLLCPPRVRSRYHRYISAWHSMNRHGRNMAARLYPEMVKSSAIKRGTGTYCDASALIAAVGSLLLSMGIEVLVHLAHCHRIQCPCP